MFKRSLLAAVAALCLFVCSLAPARAGQLPFPSEPDSSTTEDGQLPFPSEPDQSIETNQSTSPTILVFTIGGVAVVILIP